jgi:hypothetical protein
VLRAISRRNRCEHTSKLLAETRQRVDSTVRWASNAKRRADAASRQNTNTKPASKRIDFTFEAAQPVALPFGSFGPRNAQNAVVTRAGLWATVMCQRRRVPASATTGVPTRSRRRGRTVRTRSHAPSPRVLGRARTPAVDERASLEPSAVALLCVPSDRFGRGRKKSCALMEMERRAKAYPSVLLGAAPPP